MDGRWTKNEGASGPDRQEHHGSGHDCSGIENAGANIQKGLRYAAAILR